MAECWNVGMLPCLILSIVWILGLVFGWQNKGLWTHVLHRSCSYIYELDARLLNHQNWTFTADVMVHFQGLPQVRLFLSLCPDFGTGFLCLFSIDFRTDLRLFNGWFYGLTMACLRPALWLVCEL